MISEGIGGFVGPLCRGGWFGSSIAVLGNAAEGELELAIGAMGDDDVEGEAGAEWIVTINQERMVTKQTKPRTTGLFGVQGRTGRQLTSVGDLNADGMLDLAATLNPPFLHPVFDLINTASAEVRLRSAEGVSGVSVIEHDRRDCLAESVNGECSAGPLRQRSWPSTTSTRAMSCR